MSALGACALLALIAPATLPAWSDLGPLYKDLHAHPELSFQETATAAKLAARLRSLGFEVTEGVGRKGIVGVLRNGPGPVVMLRTELDALPLEEKTGLPYASTSKGVMHACGHDVHMTAWAGAAATLSGARATWSGTLVMIGQPAEEIGAGARAMLDDGLLTRFPRPDAIITIHDLESLPSGSVGIKAGPVKASSDSVDVRVFGSGGHGARPHLAVDPIVIAAKIVVGLQTLISRENDPFEPAVVTVGSFHAGTKHNIIPDEARLQLTVRAYSPEVRDRLLKGIERIATAEAEAARAPKPPEITISESLPTTINDAALAARVEQALRRDLGDARVLPGVTLTSAEDFSLYGRAGVPALMITLGATRQAVLDAAKVGGPPPGALHSPTFAPDAEAAVTTGVEAFISAARAVLGPGR